MKVNNGSLRLGRTDSLVTQEVGRRRCRGGSPAGLESRSSHLHKVAVRKADSRVSREKWVEVGFEGAREVAVRLQWDSGRGLVVTSGFFQERQRSLCKRIARLLSSELLHDSQG